MRWFVAALLAMVIAALCYLNFPGASRGLVSFYRQGSLVSQRRIAELSATTPSQIVVVQDPHEQARKISYEGFAVDELLARIFDKTDLGQFPFVTLICSDGYRVVVERASMGGGEALLAFKRADQREFSIINHLANPQAPHLQQLAPLYLIWRQGAASTAQLWPYQIISLDLVEHNEESASIPHPTFAATGEVKQGYELFRRNCLGCHGGGEGEVPTVRQLAARLHEKGFVWFQSWVQDPQASKPEAKMPAIKLSIADINAIIRYLKSSSF